MLKQKEYNISDSNIAMLGSDLEKKVKLAASQKEPAWDNAGKAVGLLIWRIEKFHVIAWPKDQYGSFFSGDSYIVLHTYKKPQTDKLLFDVHFWLGKYTTQDEAGTAAYKTVELDDRLGGDPIQHREVQGYESELFLSYFKGKLTIMDGGVETGFKHVEPEKYRPRLLHVKGTKTSVRVMEVPLTRDSMNCGDVFILDLGLQIYQFNGRKSGPFERSKAASVVRALGDERQGKPAVEVYEEGMKVPHFWKHLGGEGTLKEATDDNVGLNAEKVLFRLSDASGKLEFKEVGRGKNVKKNLLDSSDVFILDTGAEVYAWIGRKASVQEKQKALSFAQQYLTNYNRPAFLPIARILEGGENEVFEAALR